MYSGRFHPTAPFLIRLTVICKSMLNDSEVRSTLVLRELTSSEILRADCAPIMPPNHLSRNFHEEREVKRERGK